MQGDPLGNKLVLVLAKAVVNKLSDSLAVVIVKRVGYTASYSKAQSLVETVQHRQKRSTKHLITLSRRWRLRYWRKHTLKAERGRGRFPFTKKTWKNLVVAKVEFPIGKKLFHLVVNPGTSQCPTVDLELVQTTRNVNGTRDSVRKFQPGKRDHLVRFSTFSENFTVGRTDKTCSIYRRTGNSGNFD